MLLLVSSKSNSWVLERMRGNGHTTQTVLGVIRPASEQSPDARGQLVGTLFGLVRIEDGAVVAEHA